MLRPRRQAAARPRRRPPRHRRAGPRQAGRRPRRRPPWPRPPRPPLEDPRYHYLLARAFDDDDRARSEKELDEALKINPRHVDSLLLRAAHRIDDERYAEAGELLKQVFAVNPQEPRAWAYQAVLAHLRNHPEGEADGPRSGPGPLADEPRGRPPHRPRAVAASTASPRARPTSGRPSSSTPTTCPAKVQLCQDLLRLGRRGRGLEARRRGLRAPTPTTSWPSTWSPSATAWPASGPCRPTASSSGWTPARPTSTATGSWPCSAGRGRPWARSTGSRSPEPVIVEIFPQKKEFAVRTFGLPGAEGFLGVCFGRVITANSPASQGEHPSNWEAVLWHEYCHVVTLNKTQNKMPRWLSEGISVYEEEQENPAWGVADHPAVPGDDPGRRLHPAEPAQLGVPGPEVGPAPPVRLLRVGPGRRVPGREGRACRPSRASSTTSAPGSRSTRRCRAGPRMTLEQLDAEFAAFARKKAEAVAPGMTWDEPELPADGRLEGDRGLAREAPQELPRPPAAGRAGWWPRRTGRRRRRRSRSSRPPIPDYVGEDNAYVLLAAVCRKTSDPAGERAALEALAARDGDAGPAYLRLMELEEAVGRLEGPGPRRPADAGRQPPDPGPAPGARPGLRAARARTPRPWPPTGPWPSSTSPTRPTPITAWPGSSPGSASRPRPAARSSSRWKRPPGSSTPTGSCSNWSGPTSRPPDPPDHPGPRARADDAKTPDPGRRPARPGRSSPALALGQRGSAAGGGRPGPDPRGPRGGARLEGRRAVQGRRLHLRPGRVQRRRRRRRGRGGCGGGGGWRRPSGRTDFPDSDLNFSYRLQQLTSLKVNPEPDPPAG